MCVAEDLNRFFFFWIVAYQNARRGNEDGYFIYFFNVVFMFNFISESNKLFFCYVTFQQTNTQYNCMPYLRSMAHLKNFRIHLVKKVLMTYFLRFEYVILIHSTILRLHI
jgi:hypothetical protein